MDCQAVHTFLFFGWDLHDVAMLLSVFQFQGIWEYYQFHLSTPNMRTLVRTNYQKIILYEK